MAKSTGQKIRMGIFVIAGVILFGVAVYFIGNKQSLFGKTFAVKTIFRNVNGLQVGNNVRYSGINVGTVNKLELLSDTSILVEMRLEEKVRPHIRKDAIATIGSDGLVGSMIINIIPGRGVLPVVESGDQLESYSRISANDMLSTLNVTNENAALLTADLLEITRAINNGHGTLGLLVHDPVVAKNLDETVTNLKNTSRETVEFMKQANMTLQQINNNETLAGMITTDTVIAGQFKSIIADLERFSTGVNSSLDSINVFLTAINDLSKEIKTNKGPLNAAIYDTLLVNELNQSVMNIRKGTQQFNEVMEAVKQSRFLRKYFNLEKENANSGKKSEAR
jgi:phospholipid/cholesterol/gamma-HCH transport system substrate-binding protein